MREKPSGQTEISIHKDESTDRPVLRSLVRRLWGRFTLHRQSRRVKVGPVRVMICSLQCPTKGN